MRNGMPVPLHHRTRRSYWRHPQPAPSLCSPGCVTSGRPWWCLTPPARLRRRHPSFSWTNLTPSCPTDAGERGAATRSEGPAIRNPCFSPSASPLLQCHAPVETRPLCSLPPSLHPLAVVQRYRSSNSCARNFHDSEQCSDPKRASGVCTFKLQTPPHRACLHDVPIPSGRSSRGVSCRGSLQPTRVSSSSSWPVPTLPSTGDTAPLRPPPALANAPPGFVPSRLPKSLSL